MPVNWEKKSPVPESRPVWVAETASPFPARPELLLPHPPAPEPRDSWREGLPRRTEHRATGEGDSATPDPETRSFSFASRRPSITLTFHRAHGLARHFLRNHPVPHEELEVMTKPRD